MKTITQLILIVIILISTQLLSQVENESKNKSAKFLPERIMSKSSLNEQIKYSLKL